MINFSELKTSWTKYDAVRVIEVVYSIETLHKFKNKEAPINEPILRSFLGIKSLKDPLPDYWVEIQNYPKEKKLFALLAALFMHGEVVKEFANKYATGHMKGIFKIQEGKQYTNIRSALVEAGASQPIYRRSQEVPYDFSIVLENPKVGKLFKKVLEERILRISNSQFDESEFYEVCITNQFHKALSLSESQFKLWLEGKDHLETGFIKKVEIKDFFSIDEACLNFDDSKEIYFLGENGDGKSLILMAIYLAFNGNFVIEKTDQEKTGRAADILRNNKNIKLTGYDNFENEYNPNKSIHLNNLFGYGTHRGRYSAEKSEEYGFMSLFDSDQTLLSPTSWLKDQKLLELQEDNNINEPELFESLKDDSYSITSLEKIFFELLERNVEIRIEGNEVNFIEKGMFLSFDQLSEGYKSILIFVSDLIYHLKTNSQPSESFTNVRGVVLVDEIDLHLHPKWQRVLVGKLRNLLPNIQFIFTTHSPTIIQGASNDAIIFRVYRNTLDGKTRVSDPYYRKNLDHLMINTILTSPLFGLEDSRMNHFDNESDTSPTYLLYRINKKLEQELDKQKSEGKNFIKDEEIDLLIQTIIDQELSHD